ncbi:MAG: transposase [Planctomycetota bacterium]|nr:transposase [Planctomycetota bacterium]
MQGDLPDPFRKRCKRWDIPFHAHCLTFSCFRRQPFLRSERTCRWFLEALAGARAKHPFDLWAYVIMPEHVHLVLWPHEGVGISRILKGIKLPVTGRVLAWVTAHAPEFLPRMIHRNASGQASRHFWQRGGGYDRNLRSVRDTHEKIRGLVAVAEDWPWSSAAPNGPGQSIITLDRDTIPVVLP